MAITILRMLVALPLLAASAIAGAPQRNPILTPPNTRILWQVPLNRQSTNYSCGAAAMKSVLAYYGVDLPEEEIMRQVNSTPQNGTEMEPMAAMAEKHGITAGARTSATLADLEGQASAGQVTIVSLQAYR